MKIMIDARSVDMKQSGVGNYVTHLIKGLKDVDQKNRYALMVTKGQVPTLTNDLGKFEIFIVPFSNESHFLGDPWEFFFLPGALRKNRVNLFHGPAFMAPPFQKEFHSVATIHDLVAFHHPQTIPLKYAYYMRFLIRLMIKKASGILTDTEFIRNEIIHAFHIDESRIFAVPIAVADLFRPVTDAEKIRQVKRRYGIKKRYFLHVGNIEPRKNLSNLFKACRLVWEKLRKDFQLVVVGKKGWLYGDIFATLRESGIASDVVFTGYVKEKDIPVLYSGAEFFVFPSVYEGFGLPVLEAMRCGAPVMTSHVSSMPEVAGDAALYVNPYNIEDIAEKILALAYNKTLRERLREKGFIQASKFSWKETARKTLQVYETIG